jgi:hypothetical protein
MHAFAGHRMDGRGVFVSAKWWGTVFCLAVCAKAWHELPAGVWAVEMPCSLASSMTPLPA